MPSTRAVNEALRVAKDYKGVTARSGNNQTYPVYAKGNVLQGWRGRAEIRIESRDFEAASGLIGKLQAGMQLGNISFSVSPEARRSAENELIAEAIAAFKARAEIVKAALAGRGYKLQRLNLANGYGAPPPPRCHGAHGRVCARGGCAQSRSRREPGDGHRERRHRGDRVA